jgi:hypothetical protein
MLKMKNIIIVLFTLNSIILAFEFGENNLSLGVEKFLKGIMLSGHNNSGGFLKQARNLNFSDFSINALLFMAQRSMKLEISARNDSSNTFPINIDTQSLSILVDELSNYDRNLNMTLRIYEDPNRHEIPKIVTDIDGNAIYLGLGLEFGVFEDEQATEPTIVLNIDVSVRAKIQLDVVNNKLSILMANINVRDIKYNVDVLQVNRDLLSNSLTNFMKVAINGFKDKIEDINVLKIINDLIGSDFTNFDILNDYGFTIIILN